MLSSLESARLETQSFVPTPVTLVNSIEDFTRVKVAYAYSCTVQGGLCRHHQSAFPNLIVYRASLDPLPRFRIKAIIYRSCVEGAFGRPQWHRPWSGCLLVYSLRFANFVRSLMTIFFICDFFTPLPGEREPPRW